MRHQSNQNWLVQLCKSTTLNATFQKPNARMLARFSNARHYCFTKLTHVRCVCVFFNFLLLLLLASIASDDDLYTRCYRYCLVDFYFSINVLTLLEWVLLVDSLPMFIHSEQLTASLAISAPSLLHPSIPITNHLRYNTFFAMLYLLMQIRYTYALVSVCLCVCFNFNHSKATNNCLLCTKRMLDI